MQVRLHADCAGDHDVMNYSYIANRYGAMTALFIASAALCASVTGLLRSFDDAMYDYLRSIRINQPSSSDILLVEFDATHAREVPPEVLAEVTRRIAEFKPARVGVAFEVSEAQRRSLWSAGLHEVVVGESLKKLATEAANVDPGVSLRVDLDVGYTDLLYDQIIYRKHKLVANLDGRKYRAFEALLVQPLLLSSFTELPDQVTIDYLGGRDSLPIIHASSVLRREAVPELVENRVVLIGLRGELVSDIAIPSPNRIQKLTRLEIHGHVVRTLIGGTNLVQLGTVLQGILFACVAFVGCLFFRHTSLRNAVLSIILCFLSLTLISWLSVHSISVQMPLSAMFLAVLLSAVQCLAFRFRVLAEFVESWTLLRQSRQATASRSEQRDLWERIADATYQLFYPERLALLDLQEGSQHLRIACLKQCSSEEIRERRRDISRVPYKDAIQTEKAVRNERRAFFEESKTGLAEFLVPLMSSGKVYGFMTLQVKEASLEKWPSFETFLSGYAKDVANVLAQQASADARRRREERWVERLQVSPEEEQRSRLFESDAEFERRNQFLRQAFEISRTPSAVFDAFGQLAYCNRSMLNLLQDREVAVEGLNCIGLLQSVSNQSAEECRALFRRVLQDGEPQSVFVGRDRTERTYRKLFVEPVTANLGESKLSVRSVCVQVVDGILDPIALKREGTEIRDEQVRTNLNSLRQAAWMLRPEEDAPNKGGFESMLSKLEECEELLLAEREDEPRNVQAVNAIELCRGALVAFEEHAKQKDLCVVDQMEDPLTALGPKTQANPLCLAEMFEILLDCLTTSAIPESGVFVGSTSNENVQCIWFEIVTTGVSATGDSSVDAIENAGLHLTSDAESLLSSKQLDQLARLDEWLQYWDAQLRISCSSDFRLRADLRFANERAGENRSFAKEGLRSENYPLGEA